MNFPSRVDGIIYGNLISFLFRRVFRIIFHIIIKLWTFPQVY